jgi:hypothetical protein
MSVIRSVCTILGMGLLLVLPVFVYGIWFASISEQMPMCDGNIPAKEASVIMQQQEIHIGPQPETADDFSQVVDGFNTACDEYINKTDVLDYAGQWVQDDSMFRTESQWAPFHYSTVSIVGWDVLETSPQAESVQTVVRIGAVNIFQAPLWWREQLLFTNLDYAICAYFNETTRLIASGRTKSAKLQTMIYTNFTGETPAEGLIYAYDIVNAGPYTELQANNTYWGQTRLHFIDISQNNLGFGRKCFVWSRYFYGAGSITWPTFPILATLSLGAFVGLLYMMLVGKKDGYVTIR